MCGSSFKKSEENYILYVIVPKIVPEKIQFLDLSVNKPAKDYMKRGFTVVLFAKWMAQGSALIFQIIYLFL